MDIQIVRGESFILLVDPRDTRDKGWIMSSDIREVILSFRESETGEVLLTLKGVVEKIGESVDEPGKLAVFLHTTDTYKLPTGNIWYDIVILKTGHWFDINEHTGLYCKIDYGKIRDSNGNWMEIEEGWIELIDNEVNFLQITKNGEYKITTGDYEKTGEEYVNYNLYRIITEDGEIVDTFPYTGWFEEGTHSGLDFYYGEGKVLDEDNVIQEVEAGYITLKPNITNYIEVSKDGVVSSNITRFTNGRYPLYAVVTDETGIVSVERQETSFIIDDRNIYVRGDTYTPSIKARATVTWTPTEIPEEG